METGIPVPHVRPGPAPGVTTTTLGGLRAGDQTLPASRLDTTGTRLEAVVEGERAQYLTTEQHDLACALMAGRHPGSGEQLVAPKVAVPADAKVPLGPFGGRGEGPGRRAWRG